jgi:hypothetical protein
MADSYRTHNIQGDDGDDPIDIIPQQNASAGEIMEVSSNNSRNIQKLTFFLEALKRLQLMHNELRTENRELKMEMAKQQQNSKKQRKAVRSKEIADTPELEDYNVEIGDLGRKFGVMGVPWVETNDFTGDLPDFVVEDPERYESPEAIALGLTAELHEFVPRRMKSLMTGAPYFRTTVCL